MECCEQEGDLLVLVRISCTAPICVGHVSPFPSGVSRISLHIHKVLQATINTHFSVRCPPMSSYKHTRHNRWSMLHAPCSMLQGLVPQTPRPANYHPPFAPHVANTPHNSALNLSRRKSIDLWGYTRISGCKALDLPSSGSWPTAHGSRLTAHGSRLTAHGSRLTAHHQPGSYAAAGSGSH
jgi:hypothetical protein